jgi:hypothetical protein
MTSDTVYLKLISQKNCALRLRLEPVLCSEVYSITDPDLEDKNYDNGSEDTAVDDNNCMDPPNPFDMTYRCTGEINPNSHILQTALEAPDVDLTAKCSSLSTAGSGG